jgi:hypothetical protein
LEKKERLKADVQTTSQTLLREPCFLLQWPSDSATVLSIILRSVSMIENNDARDHWKELAEQLGLPPESQGSATAPEPERPKSRRPEREPEARHKEAAPVVEKRFEAERADDRGRSHRSYSRESQESSQVSEPPAILEDIKRPLQPEAAELQEERPSRRGERPSAQEEEVEVRGSESHEEKPGVVAGQEEENARGRRRRGGRGGKRRQEEDRPEGKGRRSRDVAPKPKAEVVEEKATQTVEEDDADDMEDLTNWTVPSWQELISSLYRPDR